MRGKSERTDKKGKRVDVVTSAVKGSGEREGRLGARGRAVFIEDSKGKDLGKGRLDDVGFGVSGVLKAWTFQASGHGHGNERGQSPPPLPVPIASFTI